MTARNRPIFVTCWLAVTVVGPPHAAAIHFPIGHGPTAASAAAICFRKRELCKLSRYFAFIRSVSSVQAGCLSLHSLFLIALGRLSFVGDAFWRESQGLSTPKWPMIVLSTQRLLEDSSYWSKTTAQTLGVNKRLTSSLFFSNLHFLASGAVAGQAGRGERGSRGQQDSATRDLRGAQVC